jgi:CysZ protein
MIKAFATGFMAPIRGGKLILSDPVLLRYSILPFLIMAVAFGVGFTAALPEITAFLVGLVPVLTGWMVVLQWLGIGLAYLVGFLFVILFLVMFASVISSPFQGLLAEKALMRLGVIEDQPFRFSKWIKTTASMLLVSLKRAAVFLVVGSFLFVLALIPGVQIVAGFLGLVIIAADCMDFSLEILEFNFRSRLRFLKRNFWYLAGLGCCFGLSFLVPVLNFFLLPAAVVGGSILSKELKLKRGMKLE